MHFVQAEWDNMNLCYTTIMLIYALHSRAKDCVEFPGNPKGPL